MNTKSLTHERANSNIVIVITKLPRIRNLGYKSMSSERIYSNKNNNSKKYRDKDLMLTIMYNTTYKYTHYCYYLYTLSAYSFNDTYLRCIFIFNSFYFRNIYIKHCLS